MNLLYLWDSEYPWDIRVEKTCNSLISQGWSVDLVARNKSRKPKNEYYNGINIHRIYSLPHFMGKLNDIFTFPLFISPVWLSRLYFVTKTQDYKLIIARDLPMVLAAIIIGKIRKIPVVLDMAECYPELLRLIWKFEPFRIQNIVVRNPYFADILENISLKNIDHVFVMIEESKQRLIRKGVPESKISIVSNTPEVTKFNSLEPSFPGMMSEYKEYLKILYVGLVNHSRGIENIINAINKYKHQNTKVVFFILGSGKAEEDLKKLVTENNLESNVVFEGWVDNKIVPQYIASADICVVPHHKCSHWDNTIPNKLFDYMAAGKPILASNAAPVERIVKEVKCGVIFEDYNIDEVVDGLVHLADPIQRQIYSTNSLTAIEERYNWNVDSSTMFSTVNQLANESNVR